MAITITSCCSKPPLPPSNSSPKTHQITRLKNEKWRRQYMIGMACVIVGLEISDLSIESLSIGMAKENYSTVVESKITQQRWSDKRICPSWNLNSLETIVPENLPRPSARRRWESVGHTNSDRVRTLAPQVGVVVKRINDCFTM